MTGPAGTSPRLPGDVAARHRATAMATTARRPAGRGEAGRSQRCADWLTDAGERVYAAGVRAYAMDLRERVVAAVDAGMSQSQAAARFGVSLRTVERYLARRRATGSLAVTEQRHGPEPTVRRRLQAWLPAR